MHALYKNNVFHLTPLERFLLLLLGLFLLNASTSFSGEWKYTSPTNFGVYQIPSFSYNSFLYNNGSDAYQWAQINNDGTLGIWTSALHASAGALWGAAATTSNMVYGSGGNLINSIYNTPDYRVWHAGFNPIDGSLLNYTVQESPAMHTSRQHHSCLILNNRFYAFGGYSAYNGSEGALSSVEFAPINSDSSVGFFQYTSSFSNISGAVYLAFSFGSSIYCYGSNSGDSTYIERSFVNPDGTLSPWITIASYTGMNGHAVLTQNSTIFLVQDNNQKAYELSLIPTGTFSNWIPAASTLYPRSDFSIAGWGKYVYAIGGLNSTVEYYDPYSLPTTGFRLDFVISSDTSNFTAEPLGNTSGLPTFSWVSGTEAPTGAYKLQFTSPNQGVKLTLSQLDWFSAGTGQWYRLKAHLYSDRTGFNNLYVMAFLYNGIFTTPTQFNTDSRFSLDIIGLELNALQLSEGGIGSLYPQLVIKNNNQTPAVVYIDWLELKPVTSPGE